ncbi:family 3 adenylate cyclase [Candidatus Nitrososphaera evergladensis SR1]|jgi:class 3 adenylate cyclase|uniref:Family 3 adenylate cyclase n=2 Tax=Nitrososphaera TaxID=497726 RepID=A0A075MP12_9ARCH|nr:family 3 adenylate cyclase [Candidatus Nitrososphaera evergladensis SR1]
MMVDMVNSTRTACQLGNSSKLRLFYEIFINTMSRIATRLDARVVKNGGDSIICYFPGTRDCVDKSCLLPVLTCGLEMINARMALNYGLQSIGLPAVSYRISADYGRHEVAKDPYSDTIDLFGPTMSLCAKINSLSPANSLVIGEDLYEIVKTFSDFTITKCGEYRLDEFRSYLLYVVSKGSSKEDDNDVLTGRRDCIIEERTQDKEVLHL